METKRINSPVRAKDERINVGEKVMAAIFFDPFDLISLEYINSGETITDERYVQIQHNLSIAIRMNRHKKAATNVLFHLMTMHQSIELSHEYRTSSFGQLWIRNFTTCALYSPDLSTCDFYFVPCNKRNMDPKDSNLDR